MALEERVFTRRVPWASRPTAPRKITSISPASFDFHFHFDADDEVCSPDSSSWCDSEFELGFGVGRDREERAQATAWLAPFPPGPVVKDVAVSVSPARGMRGVRVTRSALTGRY